MSPPIVDVYGYRPGDDRVFYLNPWEFLMYWKLVVIPTAEEKEKMNPALIWQKCIKVGDHVEIVGTPGRSSSGQLTIFVLDVCIVGRLGRREV